ncbi:MAG: acyl-CoA synthetase, partial [Sulfitobacter sp.]|nr:acyl-CoA synthetase [Sulfitobacter sp.]
MIKKALHAVAWRTERVIDHIRGQRDTRRIIEPYIGYATPDHLVVRGRVLTSLRRNKPKPDQSRWTNFKQMFALFLTDEVAGAEVRAGGVSAISGEEGYFTLLLPRDERTGWTDVEVTIAGECTTAVCPVMIASNDADFGIISDIDDTMLQTGAYSLLRNLWTSLTGNTATRRIFPDAVTFMSALSAAGRNPVYYVSSSPWNLHHFLITIFDKAGLVRGPKFLRDLGLSETQFITGTHGDHKA